MATRRRFTSEFKARVVLELISGAKTPGEVCRQHNLKPQVVSRWKAEFLDKAASVFHSEEQRSVEQALIAELERMVGRLTLELEVAKKASAMFDGSLARSGRWS